VTKRHHFGHVGPNHNAPPQRVRSLLLATHLRTFAKYTLFIMAEAVGLYTGIMASIGTLIQLSEIILEYLGKTAGANQEKKELLLEISACQVLLKELERKAKAPEWKNTLESMDKPDGPLQMYRSALKVAEDKLQPSKNPFIKVTNRFVWYFQQGEFAEILSKINRSKSAFDTVLNL
jgi:hypothetical protein